MVIWIYYLDNFRADDVSQWHLTVRIWNDFNLFLKIWLQKLFSDHRQRWVAIWQSRMIYMQGYQSIGLSIHSKVDSFLTKISKFDKLEPNSISQLEKLLRDRSLPKSNYSVRMSHRLKNCPRLKGKWKWGKFSKRMIFEKIMEILQNKTLCLWEKFS